MAQHKTGQADDTTRLEAERLAKEALAEIKGGDKEDGKFVLDEARKLDPDAVEQVLKEEGGTGTTRKR